MFDSLKVIVHKFVKQRNVNRLIFRFLSVISGVKHVWLIDEYAFLKYKIDEIVIDINELMGRFCLCLLVLDDTYFLINRTILIENHIPDPIVIDVSSSKKSPIITDFIPIQELHLYEEILERVQTSEQTFKVVFTDDEVRTTNLSTVFGLLIGYPIVYYFDITSSNNCLADIDLTVVKVSGTFSYRSTKQTLELFSFSYPTSVNEQCQYKIEKYLHSLESLKTDSPQANCLLSTVQNIVQLPVVAL